MDQDSLHVESRPSEKTQVLIERESKRELCQLSRPGKTLELNVDFNATEYSALLSIPHVLPNPALFVKIHMAF